MHIKNIFGVGNVKKQKPRILEYLDIILVHLSLNSVTVDYFLAYPLKGKKLLSLNGILFVKCCYKKNKKKNKNLKAGGIELIREKAKSITINK